MVKKAKPKRNPVRYSNEISPNAATPTHPHTHTPTHPHTHTPTHPHT
jgi:hypothetical protein